MTDGRVALVTGGARGIGGATCAALRAAGFRVAVGDIAGADEAARKLDPTGSTAFGIVADVTSTSSVDEMVQTVLDRYGRLDALVNNAGTINPEPSHVVSDDSWGRLLEVHLGGTFRCSRAAFPALRESGSGTIVNMASVAAHIGLPGRLSYSAAKSALEGVTRCLAVEWAEFGIRVNAVAPGYTRTALVSQAIDSGMLNETELKGKIPLRRLAEPEEIANLVVFLSTAASSYITGQALVIDGGLIVNSSW